MSFMLRDSSPRQLQRCFARTEEAFDAAIADLLASAGVTSAQAACWAAGFDLAGFDRAAAWAIAALAGRD